MKEFKSILEFQKHFSTDEICREHLELSRWNGTPACPFCGVTNVRIFPNGKIFKCRDCRKKFSVTVGTMYENTKIPLTKWFLATYILTNHSKGISSLQLSIWLNVTQKTAWFLNHRIREMLTDKNPDLLTGTVEIDETYVGGSDKNRHKHKKKGRGDKTMVVGAIQRKITEEVDGKVKTKTRGKVKTKVIPATDIANVTDFIIDNVKEGSNMVTDESHAYNKVKLFYKHETVNHRDKEYVRKDNKAIHTNTIEGVWNLLKKQIDGIHHSVSAKHLQRYCNEGCFRYNRKDVAQDERFEDVITRCEGRLKYQDLISKA